ncbi:hypothetical protein [Pseudomonas pseudonitroreducens]|uniref:hypothetical protein n=1 Tax=Pseudomonas pseudonitroreducens TaxID=2892326 RepID=UPI001F4568C0|nr:hypothetical protein [Pseudomonas pseudonitroreducens]
MTAPADLQSKEFHQAMAMLFARAVRESYSADHKQKARSMCLAHLRASLARHPVAAGESDFNNVTQEA